MLGRIRLSETAHDFSRDHKIVLKFNGPPRGMLFVALRPVLLKRVEAWTVLPKRAAFSNAPQQGAQGRGVGGRKPPPIRFKVA